MNMNKSNSGVPLSNIKNLIIEFDSQFNNKKYTFYLFDIGNDTLEILAKENFDDNTEIIELNKYNIILQLEELKALHRYFKMFDTFDQAKSDIIELCKANSIKIIKIKENELIISFDLKMINNNSLIISLNKMNNDSKENITFLFKCYNEQKKEIKELKNTIKEMNNIITDLTKRILILEGKSENKRIEIKNSNIIKSNEELMFLFNAISSNPNKLSLHLLYNSNIDGENSEKFKSGYLNKNDIIIFVKTKKNKRFGGYTHEAFKNNEEFEKKDLKAFLFNLDKMKIYKSKGSNNSIWNNCGNSMDFGSGTDLRIFHNFFQSKNYTNQCSSDYDYDEEYALNGEKSFEIKYLELYKIIFN